ncbi:MULTISPECIES: erythromycin esterase family protein [Micromonospora]|uniref:Erythromycin esterase family protein n=1 Tax=Micromonospora solifontis TaxID=2487138 RepID=A0ABX9WAP4_9ACTN|nr:MULTISPECIES: erythromycin esterase family protein [Micromonospora]RNL88343.1 erythromycin esterase family protein [Micromonospora solifontis]
MSQDIRDLVPASCDLLALGEPTHQEPAFGAVRNELFAQLVELGFRSIALETDRVAALAVNDHVLHGTGSLDSVLREGFSHDFGALAANRQLVAWMREYNRDRPAQERLTFHGFDAPTENTSAPSPRSYFEYARDYLQIDNLDIAGVAGDDDRWSRAEAILDFTRSMGATPEAERLRAIGEDLLTRLYARAPELIARTSRAEWLRARTHLDAGLGLLHYHWQAAQPLGQSDRICLLLATRDTWMARNLLDIRGVEAERGPTMLSAHNLHLQRNGSAWSLGEMGANWFGAGAIVDSLRIGSYFFVAASLGRSAALKLGEPEPDTFEGFLQHRITDWGLLPATEVLPGRKRVDTTPQQGYFPLDQATVDAADAILHVTA